MSHLDGKITKKELEKEIARTEKIIYELENKKYNNSSLDQEKIIMQQKQDEKILNINKTLLENYKSLLEEGEYDDDFNNSPRVSRSSIALQQQNLRGGGKTTQTHKLTDKTFNVNGKKYRVYLGARGGKYIKKNNKFVLVSTL